MRRALRRIRSDKLPARSYRSLHPALTSEMGSAQVHRDALMLELELKPRFMLNIFAYALVAASLILLSAHLLAGVQVWHVQLLLVGIYLLASAAVKRLISGPITFITLIASALLGWI